MEYLHILLSGVFSKICSFAFTNTPFRLMTYNGLNVEGNPNGSRNAYFQTVF